MDKFTRITPTATFIENRLRLGHPSKLVALSLHYFCAYSARCSWGTVPGALPQALYFCAYSACSLLGIAYSLHSCYYRHH